MLAIVEILILALAVMAFAPEIPLAKSLRFWLLEKPADALSRRMNFIVALVVVASMIALMAAAPEVFTIIGVGDLFASLSAYLDAVIILSLMGAAARLNFTVSGARRLRRTVVARLAAFFGRNRMRNRRLRLRRTKIRPSPNDPEPHEDWVFA